MLTDSLGLSWSGEGFNLGGFCSCLGEGLFDFLQVLCSQVVVMVSVWSERWNPASRWEGPEGETFFPECIYIIMTQAHLELMESQEGEKIEKEKEKKGEGNKCKRGKNGFVSYFSLC